MNELYKNYVDFGTKPLHKKKNKQRGKPTVTNMKQYLYHKYYVIITGYGLRFQATRSIVMTITGARMLPNVFLSFSTAYGSILPFSSELTTGRL